MRTLQEKYNAIQEGKFSKEHFLAEARMQQPQLITRFNGYDDAVQILKNRGMIAEISSDTFKSAVDVARGRGEDRRASKLGSTFLNSFVGKPLMGGTISKIDIQKPSFGDYFDVTLEVLVPTQGTDGMYDKPKYLYYDVEKDDWNMKGKGLEVSRQDARVLSQIAIKINPDTKYRQGTQHFDIAGMNEAKQTKLTKKSLTDYRYKPTNEMDKYPYEQILRGLRVELETMGVQGTPTAEEYTKALAKVSKNLAKDPIFYTNQVAGVNPKVDQHDQMIPATAKNTVDTFNGMKKAALKEGFKKLIKKVLSESSNDLADLFDNDEEREERRYTTNDYGDHGPESDFGDSFDNMDPENYSEEDEMFEMYGEDSVDESRMGDVHILAQEAGTLRDFLLSVKAQHPEVDLRRDIEELQDIWNNREQDQVDYDDIDISDPQDKIDYDDENFSDPFIDGEDDLFEGQKSLSELLK